MVSEMTKHCQDQGLKCNFKVVGTVKICAPYLINGPHCTPSRRSDFSYTTLHVFKYKPYTEFLKVSHF